VESDGHRPKVRAAVEGEIALRAFATDRTGSIILVWQMTDRCQESGSRQGRLSGTHREGELMRRGVAIVVVLAIGFLSACFPTPAAIVERVPETVIVTALIRVPMTTPTLESTPPPPATSLPGSIASPLSNAVVAADLLNLRSEPDIRSELVATFEQGLALQVTGRNAEGDWLKVKYHTVEGWVAARFIELSVPPDTIRIVTGEAGAPAGITPIPAGQGVLAQVLRVIDGATIEVSIDDETHGVRYLGIDVSEKPGEAAAENERLVGERTVILEQDAVDTDERGRLLRYVWLGDLLVNAELLRLGYAQVSDDPPGTKYQELFRQLEEEAQEAGPGLRGTITTTAEITPTVTLTPTIPIPPLCPDTRARLTYPTQDAQLEGAVEIRGSANIADFQYYKFEFRGEAGGEWAFLARFDAAVVDGVLGRWDVSALPDGTYDFRLVVVDRSGNYPEPCEVHVVIDR
jgi:micrococcal nuclease